VVEKHKTRSLKWILKRKLNEVGCLLDKYDNKDETNRELILKYSSKWRDLFLRINAVNCGLLENRRINLKEVGGIRNFKY